MLKLGSIVAWLLISLGALRAAMGYFVAIYYADYGDMVIAAKRYLGTSSPADAQDSGFLVLIAGVVLGLLVKIAKRSS